MDSQTFALNKNFRGKNFRGYRQPAKFLLHAVHGDKMCDQFDYSSVIRGHHI